ncbi:MAG: hypothetical protein V7K94_10070 [Nostoc sp.]|uniref:hypothetical protein n=1 Tax=Nostoc sp. TaxID=1180 RepID=UPI002FF9DAEC
MARRFNNLKAALKYLRPPGANENSVVPDAPEGTQLRKFQDFKAGKVIVKITRATDSLPGNETFCALKPFGLLASDTAKYLVGLSGRASAGIGATGLSFTDHLNIDTTPAGIAGLEKEKGFIAAKATVSVIPTGAGTATSSKVTGNSYKKKATKTYTFPFGAGATHPNYKSVKAAIIAASSTGTANRGVSFKPEKF